MDAFEQGRSARHSAGRRQRVFECIQRRPQRTAALATTTTTSRTSHSPVGTPLVVDAVGMKLLSLAEGEGLGVAADGLVPGAAADGLGVAADGLGAGALGVAAFLVAAVVGVGFAATRVSPLPASASVMA